MANIGSKVRAGIFATGSLWAKHFGSACNLGSTYPLWYANYATSSVVVHTGNVTKLVDDTMSFDDFNLAPFGGFTPLLKQVGGNVTIHPCSENGNGWHARIDNIWHP